MLNKTLAAILIGLTAFLITPKAMASDIPVLTWEKGKEHNLVIGGNNKDVKDWKIELISGDQATATFSPSRFDKKGYIVYSVQVPDSFVNGVYTVQLSSKSMPPKVIAGVRIVSISAYNLIQIPVKLFTILLALVFLITTLSIIRMKKYERIEYLRSKPADRIPGVFNLFYRFRYKAVDEINKSLFKFQLIREGELLHEISPILWSIVPIAALFLGGFVGVNGTVMSGVNLIPVALYFITAVIGVIDPFSGLMAGVGFAITQCVGGNVTSVRSIMSLLAVGIGWVVPGILSSLYQELLRKDDYPKLLKKLVPDLAAGAVGGLIFLVSELLTNSFADHRGPISVNNLALPALLAVIIVARINLQRFLVKDLHQKGVNYQIRVLVLPRVLSPRTIAIAALYFIGTAYVWTESWKFAGITAFLLSFPLSLLMVRFDSPVIKRFTVAKRHILLESLFVCFIAYVAFYYIQGLPLEVTQKGKLFILYAAVILFIHGLYSSIFDTSSRAEQNQDISEMEMA
jgi:hypothetical protein